MMDRQEYLQTQQQLIALSSVVVDIDLDEFVNMIGKAEVVGPIMNPTNYVKAMNNMSDLRRLAISLRPFQKVVKEIRERKL